MKETPRTIVGIDHGFSFPLAYFEKYGMQHDWDVFLNDFCDHWPTDAADTYVDFVRDGSCGRSAARRGSSKWRRLTEIRTPNTRSVFHFDVQGQVAKSTHAGIPWLCNLRKESGSSIHFWPFDGWAPQNGSHVLAEVFPSLWRNHYPTEGRTRDQQDAYAVCQWLWETARADNLTRYFHPLLTLMSRQSQSLKDGF